MANPYVGAQVWHASIIIPSDGDPAVAESVNIAFRDLMDDAAVLRTDMTHQAADDRGITSTVTGNIVWNDGGGSFTLNLPFTSNGQTDLDATNFHGDVNVLTGSNFQARDDATFGTTGTDQFTVNSTSDFNAPVAFNGDVEITGDGDTFTTHGDVQHGGGVATFRVTTAVIQLGTNPVTQVLNVGCNANFDQTVDIDEDLNIDGTLTVDGAVEFGSSLDVDNDMRINGALQVDSGLDVTSGGAEIHGAVQLFSTLSVAGNTSLGNSSSDTITCEGVLTGGLAMGANGRVLPSTGSVSASGTTTLTVASSRIIAVLGGSSPILLAIDDTGMLPGDQFQILFSAGTSTLEVYIAGTAITETVSVNSVFLCTRFPGAAATNWSIVNWNRD